MTSKLEYMLIGFALALLVYLTVLASTDNQYLAALCLLGSMAFWIGTLKVIIKKDF